jgi:hypothetical protein
LPVIVRRVPPYIEPVFGEIEVIFDPTVIYSSFVLISPY